MFSLRLLFKGFYLSRNTALKSGLVKSTLWRIRRRRSDQVAQAVPQGSPGFAVVRFGTGGEGSYFKHPRKIRIHAGFTSKWHGNPT